MQAIAPVIKSMAEGLKHTEYYIPRSVDGSWLMVTLKNRNQPSVEKRIVSAYATLADAEVGSQIMNNLTIEPIQTPVTHILFHMLALKPVDSVIFFETPNNLEQGTEIFRNTLQENIKKTRSDAETKFSPHYRLVLNSLVTKSVFSIISAMTKLIDSIVLNLSSGE